MTEEREFAIPSIGRDFSAQWAVLGFDTTQCCEQIQACWWTLMLPVHS